LGGALATALLLAPGAGAPLGLGSGAARANGRYPESNAYFFSPTSPDLILLRVTFGLLVSHDRGRTWDWVCERSIGLAGIEDPMFAITPSGTFIGSTFQGLTRSTDKGCSFAFVGGALKDLVFVDVATSAAAPNQIVAFASSYDGQYSDGGIYFKSTLYETKDDGVTFTPLPAVIAPDLLGETVDVAPSDPDRFYYSTVRAPGQKTRTAQLFTSLDHATTFAEHDIPLVLDEKAAFIAGVDPTNPERVYVRTTAATDKPTRLLVTDDAGKTWRPVFTATGPIMGFALSADGKKIWVGGPRDGLHSASTLDFAFQQRSTIEIQCLAVQPDGLWACSSERSGFVAGRSEVEGTSFEAVLHFCDIRGPLACPESSGTHLECVLGGEPRTPPWPPQRVTLGCEAPPVEDAGIPDAAASDGGTDRPLEGGGGGCGSGCAVPAGAGVAAYSYGAAALALAIGLARRATRPKRAKRTDRREPR